MDMQDRVTTYFYRVLYVFHSKNYSVTCDITVYQYFFELEHLKRLGISIEHSIVQKFTLYYLFLLDTVEFLNCLFVYAKRDIILSLSTKQ